MIKLVTIWHGITLCLNLFLFFCFFVFFVFNQQYPIFVKFVLKFMSFSNVFINFVISLVFGCSKRTRNLRKCIQDEVYLALTQVIRRHHFALLTSKETIFRITFSYLDIISIGNHTVSSSIWN